MGSCNSVSKTQFEESVPSSKLNNMISKHIKKTPLGNPDEALKHLQILTDSSVPQKLAMLYFMSPSSSSYYDHKIENGIDNNAIHDLLDLSNSCPHPQVCIPFLSEFCKCLWKGPRGLDDLLYRLCWDRLIKLVVGLSRSNISRSKLIGSLVFVPILAELATEISQELDSPDEYRCVTRRYVEDFAEILVHVRDEIVANSGGPIMVSSNLFRAEENREVITCLHKIFIQLLGHLRRRLNMVQVDYYIGYYLSLLKELHIISKLYYRCEDFFWNTMKRKKGFLTHLLFELGKGNYTDHKWLLEATKYFEVRRDYAMLYLPEVRDNMVLPILVDRSNLLASSYQYVGHDCYLESLRSCNLYVRFKDEDAVGPGVSREWLLLACQAIFNPEYGLYVACPNDRRRFFPNAASSKLSYSHLKYYRFSGRIMALALKHKLQVGIALDRVFLMHLAGCCDISLEDIRDADPYLYSGCKQILEMDPEIVDQDVLGLTFVHELDEFGEKKVIELCRNGSNIVVNSENRNLYVHSLIQQVFVTSICKQVACFAKGFADIMGSKACPKEFFQCLYPKDLDLMLYGSESEISVDDWRSHTKYEGFTEADVQISWFWEIVRDMSHVQKKVLLFFWTSIKYLPFEGFRGLASPLYIHKTFESSDHLPSSHTCIHQLSFPAYGTHTAMRDRLHIITQEHIGCSFGTI